jgi:sulfatase-modifying factor enzyme 1/Big-like domain-containing protein
VKVKFLNLILWRSALLVLTGCFILPACNDDKNRFVSTDQTPYVISTFPADGSTDVLQDTKITVTFNQSLITYTPTINTEDNGCHGNFQLSMDNFASCILMETQPVSDETGRTYTLDPSSDLAYHSTYKIRYMNPSGSSSYTMSTGFEPTNDFLSPSTTLSDFNFYSDYNSVSVYNVKTIKNRISFQIIRETDISALVASFNTQGSVKVNGVEQVSNVTVNDFSNKFLFYRVISEDRSAVGEYIVIPATGFGFDWIQKTVYSEWLDFDLVNMPGGLTFPTGLVDSSTATISAPYQVGRTEVAYELWRTVYSWAITNEYYFANAGREGNDGTDDAPRTDADMEPVTMINWRDAMVWLNALTEYYNFKRATSLTPVYEFSGSVIKDSRDSNATACDNVTINTTANGFRLLSAEEWEFAARFIRDDGDNNLDKYGEYYSGNMASGADGQYDDLLNNIDYDGNGVVANTNATARYSGNSYSQTTRVDLYTQPNSLSLYHMCGNVFEWVFDLSGSQRIMRGGSWNSYSEDLQIGKLFTEDPDFEADNLGFRIGRSP